MARPRNELPTYRHHKKTGQAIITLRDAAGERHDVLLGAHGSEESWQEYRRVVDEWRTSNGAATQVRPRGDLTLAELCLSYWRFVEGYYLDAEGQPAKQQARVQMALRPVRQLYSHTLAREFGPLALKTVRHRYLDHECQHCKGKGTLAIKPRAKRSKPVTRDCSRCAGKGRKGYVRHQANQLTECVKRMFKWAVAEQMIPVEVYHALATVEGLRKGKTGVLDVRERRKVKPVAADVVKATAEKLNRHLAALIQLQTLTGMRSGELCRLRPCDIDRTGALWLYRPCRFKGDMREDVEQKTVVLGPKAQALLLPFLDGTGSEEFLFSPARAREERFAAIRQTRKTRVQPSQQCRRKAVPKKAPGARYTSESYYAAITQACKKHGIPRWHPHQLRHNHGTAVRAKYGLEAAQVALGHAQADVTQIYAEKNQELALKIAGEMG